jgi:NAD(P) transhydrogenase subunit beta
MATLKLICFLSACVCFVIGLKMLGRTDSARRGNLVSAAGMTAAVIGTLLAIFDRGNGISGTVLAMMAGGLVIGGLAGAIVARKVQMTAIPEMVALFNGFGGLASLLVAAAQLRYWLTPGGDVAIGRFDAATLYAAMMIGGITFSGSLIAFGKLAEKLPGRPIIYPGQHWVNGAILLLLGSGLVGFSFNPQLYWVFVIATLIGLAFGVVAVLPIGGADMPVTISLLNAFSGLAACAAGFAVSNVLLVITGALVGASGTILTRIMCKAMNRSLANVLLSGFGSGASGGTGETHSGEVKSMTPEDVYYVLEAAQNVVIIPGYGMAVAQAQHSVRELALILEQNGTEVVFAIHPVAGRMPGHMNVLLAEANVPYEQLVEMEDINPRMPSVDAAVVIGANDVVNPAAKDSPDSPIYGMPIIEASLARSVFVMKRSMGTGFAGIGNDLFFKDNSHMVFGDAKETTEALIAEFKSARS